MSRKLNSAIAEMAKHMTLGIIKILGQMSVGELSSLSRDGKKPRNARSSGESNVASRTKPEAKKSGSKSARSSRAKSASKDAGRDSTKKLPVTAELRKKLKEQMFLELRSRGGVWSKMEDVVKKISFKMAPEISRRLMGELIAEGRVQRSGSTRASRYQIAKSSGEGNAAEPSKEASVESAAVPSDSSAASA